MLAGYVDAYGFIRYGTYVSFMSGNTTQSASLIGQGHLAAALPLVLAIAFFVVGVFAGTLLTRYGARQSKWLVLEAVATLLAVIVGTTQLGSLNTRVGIATLTFAMGLMNTALSHVGAQSVNVAFVTGTLNAMAQHLALAVKRVPLSEAQGPCDTHGRRALLLMGIWVSFLTGAVLAAAAISRLGSWVLLPPVVILLILSRQTCQYCQSADVSLISRMETMRRICLWR
jgi:uncharacterized membrane protein YoaK (UPF0700 family)